MTEYTVGDIVNDVRVILGHNDLSSAIAELSNDIDTLTLDEIIRREIRPAARQLLLIAPKDRIEWETHSGSASSGTSQYYYITLPKDFLRLGSAKMKSWMFPVGEATATEELAYKKQFSVYGGIKATPRRPLVAIVESVDDNGSVFQLQMFGVKISDQLDYVTYVTVPKCYNGTTEIKSYESLSNAYKLKYSNNLYQPFLYMCASLVAETLKNKDLSSSLMVSSQNLMVDIEAARRNVRLINDANKA